MRKLSEVYAGKSAKHAACVQCGEAFVDDSPLPGTLLCSNLIRVASAEEADKLLKSFGKPEMKNG